MGGPAKDKILVDASNCDFETLRRNIFRYLRSVDIKNEDASGIVHVLKIRMGLKKVRITLQHMIISIRSKLQSTMLMGMASIQISL